MGLVRQVLGDSVGPDTMEHVVKVADGKCDVSEGTADSPTVTINSPSDVWLKITRRELDGATAFMSGQFTFTGDMGVLVNGSEEYKYVNPGEGIAVTMNPGATALTRIFRGPNSFASVRVIASTAPLVAL